MAVLLAGLFRAVCASWMTHRIEEAAYQLDRQNQRLVGKGRMLEHVWPHLSRAEQKKPE
jgi:hypothetical protein